MFFCKPWPTQTARPGHASRKVKRAVYKYSSARRSCWNSLKSRRPVLVRKLALSAGRTQAFVDDLPAIATWVDPAPSILLPPRDPKDNMYVDLAIAIGAHVITSRDRHLLSLRDPADPIGVDFMSRFASIEVLTP